VFDSTVWGLSWWSNLGKNLWRYFLEDDFADIFHSYLLAYILKITF
jgi:hypothetical protein